MPTILTKRSNTPGAVPATANLTNASGGAELAVNTADKRLFTITSGSQVVELGTNPSSLTVADLSATVLRAGSATITNLIGNSLTISSGTANGVLYLNASKVATSGTALSYDGTKLQLTNTTLRLSDLYEVGWGTNTTYIAGTSSLNALLFATNSAEQMRLTSTGLGIGTSSPAVKLDVSGYTNVTNASAALSGTAKGSLRLYDTSAMASGVGAGVAFLGKATTGSDTYTTAGSVQAYKVNGTSGNDAFGLQFTTRANGSGCATVMTLDDSGNLGLGVTPSSGWQNTIKALQLVNGSQIAFSGGYGALQTNAYYDGTNYRYIIGDWAARYQHFAGQHQFFTAPSGTAGGTISFTQAMTLDASGNLGVGVTSPLSRLDVREANRANSTNIANIGVYTTTAQAANVGGTISLGGLFDGANYAPFASIRGGKENSTSGNYDGYLAFQTILNGNTLAERARITSGGDFYVNTTAAGGKVYVVSDLTANNGLRVDVPASFTSNCIALTSATAAGTGWFFIVGDSSGGSNRFQIRGDGNMYNTNGTYGTISDERLKQDIVDAPSQWNDIKAIRFRKYRMKEDVEANPDAPELLGVVAQELEQTSPGLVDEQIKMKTVAVTDDEGNVTQQQQPTGETTKTVKTSVLLMKAAVALQEAMARIEKLEAEVAALKGA